MNNWTSLVSVFMAILLVMTTMLSATSAQLGGSEGGIGGMLDGAMNTASQMTGGMI